MNQFLGQGLDIQFRKETNDYVLVEQLEGGPDVWHAFATHEEALAMKEAIAWYTHYFQTVGAYQ